MKKNIVLGLGKIQSIFINPYTACNNNCTYCAIGNTNFLDNRIDNIILQNRNKKTLEFISAIKEELEDNCQFIFLGGEPLLAWHSWLIPLIDGLNEINENFTYRLSTNATLLTPDKYNDIEKYKIDLNISLDGPAFVHNINRKSLSGADSFDLTYHNFLQIPKELSMNLHPCCTIHLNTVEYLPDIFQFMIDTYEKRPYNWFTMNETDGYNWEEKELKLFEEGMYKIKEMLPVKFNVNFIPNPPRNQNLIIHYPTGIITIKSNELSNPVNALIGNLTSEDLIFEDKLQNYKKYHLEKKGKRVLPEQELCKICPGRNTYCVRKPEEFFVPESYMNLKNFCNHNYILNKVFGGHYYDNNERAISK